MVLKKYNVKPQPVPESMKQNVSPRPPETYYSDDCDDEEPGTKQDEIEKEKVQKEQVTEHDDCDGVVPGPNMDAMQTENQKKQVTEYEGCDDEVPGLKMDPTHIDNQKKPVKHGPSIPGPSITSTILKKYNVKPQPAPESKKPTVCADPQVIDHESHDDKVQGPDMDVKDCENDQDEEVKRGPSIPGPSITSMVLKKYNVKPQPLPELKETVSSCSQVSEHGAFNDKKPRPDKDAIHCEKVRKEQAKRGPSILGPSITSMVLKKYNVKPQRIPGSQKQTVSPQPQVMEQRDKVPGLDTDAIHGNRGYNGKTRPKVEERHRKKKKGDAGQQENNERIDKTNEELPENAYAFVVLIEITFANDDRKFCTGTAIHEHVVISAAHCFEDSTSRKNYVAIPLTFIVMGTKYEIEHESERYLPIEKIIKNPAYKGWNADLALVYVYAGIKTDNHGFPIPIAGDKLVIPSTSQLMVASWDKRNGKNKLTAEEFTVINATYCKKLLAQIVALKYKITNADEMLCYTSSKYCLTKNDSGAPAIQDGKLLAMTVGGIEAGGTYYGVGIKISCFCSWIADNLPDGGDELNCCINCCGNRKSNGKFLRGGLQRNNGRNGQNGNKIQ